MPRWWTEYVARWSDLIPIELMFLGLIVLAVLVSLLWYTWPAWTPRHWRAPRWGRLRRRGGPGRRGLRALRRNRRDRSTPAEVTEEELDAVAASDEELPDVAPEVFGTLADRLAAQGRYADAVRERLRAMVRELVDRQVVAPHPGWTVTELARAAGGARPEVAPPLTAATAVFSEIWYGERPALAEHDQQMRLHVRSLHDAMASGPAAIDRPEIDRPEIDRAATGGVPR